MFQFNPVGTHQQITSLSSAQTITVPVGASGILVQALSQNVRFTLDPATVPTVSVGFEIRAGDQAVYIAAASGSIIQFIQEAASANIQWQGVYPQQFGPVLRTG